MSVSGRLSNLKRLSVSTMTNPLETDLAVFLPWLKTQIPLLNHMGMGELRYDSDVLIMPAELAPNVNDKGTGFGGSMATLATLCGWSLVTLGLRREGLDCDVMIRDSELKYLAPVTTDFAARAEFPHTDWAGFVSYLQANGRSRIKLEVSIVDAGSESAALTLSGTYFARIRD